jgi:predicted nucleotidyltransferase
MDSPLPPAVREKMIEIAARHGAGNLELFGSAARGELRPDSDVDLLLDIVGKTPPWFPGGLAVELERLQLPSPCIYGLALNLRLRCRSSRG